MEAITASRHNHPVCRACMSEPLEKFLSLGESLHQQLTIADILMMCVPQLRVELGADELPQQICADCLHKLKITYQFQQLCIASDVRLRSELSSVEPAIYTATIQRQPSTDDPLMDDGMQLTEGVDNAVPMDDKEFLLTPLQGSEENKLRCGTEEVDTIVMDIKIEEEFAAEPSTLHETHLLESKTNVENAAESISDDCSKIVTAQNDKQSTIERRCFKTNAPYNESLTEELCASVKKRRVHLGSLENTPTTPNATFNREALDILEKILESQKVFNERLSNIEHNIVTKSEILAQNKMLKECKVVLTKIRECVCHMTGEVQDTDMEEIASTLPFESVNTVQETEDKLQSPDYAHAMSTYLVKLKGASEDIGSVLRKIFSDNVIAMYNWDGRWEKRALNKLSIIDTILRDVFKAQGAQLFEANIKKAVNMSHRRQNQKKYNEKKSKV